MAADTYLVRFMFEEDATDNPVEAGETVINKSLDETSMELDDVEHVAGPDEIARENRVEYRITLTENGQYEAALRAAFFEASPYSEVETVRSRPA